MVKIYILIILYTHALN